MMGWNGKNDVIVMIFLSFGGLSLVAVLGGVIAAPTIMNIKDAGLDRIVKIIVLLGLLGCAIYILRCIYKRNKKVEK